MLDLFLKVAHQEQVKTAARDQYIELMMKLPVEELMQIRETGEVKLAFDDCTSSDGAPRTWLERFKDTPLYPQAIALEEQELQLQAADQQQDVVRDQERSQQNQGRDAIRMQKKLLELELVKAEAGAESAAAPPPVPTPGMGAPPGMGAQGAGAPGDMAPEGAGDGAPGKFAALEERFKLAAERMRKEAKVGDFLRAAAPGALAFAKKHPAMVAGGALGALHGATREGGGLGSALVEGAGGAAIGEAGQHAYGKLRGGAPAGGGMTPPHLLMSGEAPLPATAAVSKEAASKLLPFVGSEKQAFFGPMLGALGGAAMKGLAGGGGMGGLASKAMGFVKANPMKAVGAGLNAGMNMAQAHSQGQGAGGTLLSGLAGGATALG